MIKVKELTSDLREVDTQVDLPKTTPQNIINREMSRVINKPSWVLNEAGKTSEEKLQKALRILPDSKWVGIKTISDRGYPGYLLMYEVNTFSKSLEEICHKLLEDSEYLENLTIVEGNDTVAKFNDMYPEWEDWFREFGKEIPETAKKLLETEIVLRQRYHQPIQEI